MRSLIREAAIRFARREHIAAGSGWAWNKVSIRDVVEEAGVSIGTFYKYFEDRADLAQSLWAEPVEQLHRQMQADYDAAANPEAKLRALLERYVDFAIEDPARFAGIFLSVPGSQYRQSNILELDDEPFFANLKVALDEGQSAGIFGHFDTHQMAQLFWAAIHGSLALPVNLDRFKFEPMGPLSDAMIDTLLNLVLKKKR